MAFNYHSAAFGLGHQPPVGNAWALSAVNPYAPGKGAPALPGYGAPAYGAPAYSTPAPAPAKGAKGTLAIKGGGPKGSGAPLDPNSNDPITRLKLLQRRDPCGKAQWEAFANLYGQGTKDPTKYDASQIQNFLAQYENGDWLCPSCGNVNFRRRETCNRCSFPRPEGMGEVRKGKGKDKGKGKGKEELLPASINMYVTGLPSTLDDDGLKQEFEKFGTVIKCTVLQAREGKDTSAGFVRMLEDHALPFFQSLEQTKGMMMSPPFRRMVVSMVDDDKAAGKGWGKKTSKEAPGKLKALQVVDIEESCDLYVGSLPVDFDDAALRATFEQYGTVTNVRVLPAKPAPGDTVAKFTSGFVTMGSPQQAKATIARLHGNIPQGMSHKISLRFAGDPVPPAQKVLEKLQNAGADDMNFGKMRSFSVEGKCGFIVCDDIMQQTGMEVYIHDSVAEKARCGPGDTAIFFLFWKHEKPQASLPMLRIGAYCNEFEKNYALKGWYKGLTPSKSFGFIDSADLKAIFGKDVYVREELASTLSVGWVCFNAKLQRDIKDGTFSPICLEMDRCEEDWKPSAPDLSKTWELAPEEIQSKGKGKGKGKGGGDSWYSSGDAAWDFFSAFMGMAGFGGGGGGKKGKGKGKSGGSGGPKRGAFDLDSSDQKRQKTG